VGPRIKCGKSIGCSQMPRSVNTEMTIRFSSVNGVCSVCQRTTRGKDSNLELLIHMLIRRGVRFLKNPSCKALPIYAYYGIHRLPSNLRERQSWVPERKMTIACAYHNYVC
jgi:hypothetical protein